MDDASSGSEVFFPDLHQVPQQRQRIRDDDNDDDDYDDDRPNDEAVAADVAESEHVAQVENSDDTLSVLFRAGLLQASKFRSLGIPKRRDALVHAHLQSDNIFMHYLKTAEENLGKVRAAAGPLRDGIDLQFRLARLKDASLNPSAAKDIEKRNKAQREAYG